MTIRRVALVLPALLLALAPQQALAQDIEDDGFVLRVDGSVRVDDDEAIDTAIVINGDAIVDGVVRDTLLVINGDAVVSGAVEGDVTVINGVLHLREDAIVGDVNLVDSELDREPGAVVEGSITEREEWAVWDFGLGVGILRILVWFPITLFVILAGLLFAAVGGRQLSASGYLLSHEVGPSILAAVLLFAGVPVLAVITLVTIIGIPIGIILLLALPVLWFIGYLVAGTRLGSALLRRGPTLTGPAHPYLAAVIGLLLFQVIAFIPLFGWLFATLAGMLGAGAVLLLGWRGWRGSRGRAAPATGTPAPG